MAKVRRVAAEALRALDAQDREALLEKVRERYFSNFSLIDLMLFRIAELDAQFSDLQVLQSFHCRCQVRLLLTPILWTIPLKSLPDLQVQVKLRLLPQTQCHPSNG